MGKRTVLLAPQMFIDCFKNHDQDDRVYFVRDGIPDDAEVVAITHKDKLLHVTLESNTWEGESETPLPPPQIGVRFGTLLGDHDGPKWEE